MNTKPVSLDAGLRRGWKRLSILLTNIQIRSKLSRKHLLLKIHDLSFTKRYRQYLMNRVKNNQSRVLRSKVLTLIQKIFR